MLPKSIERLAQKLKQKKQRHALKLFVAEGEKTITDLLATGLTPRHLLSNGERFAYVKNRQEASVEEIKRISSLETADGTLAIFPFPEITVPAKGALALVLDNIRIPGNLGTIIRTADWFGIYHIFCTMGTTDVYNAKTIQSSMGSMGRVKVTYGTSPEVLNELNGYRLLVADTHGTDIKQLAKTPSQRTALIMGSESHGPDAFWKEKAEKVTIPRKGNSRVESLNVAIATAILLQQLS